MVDHRVAFRMMDTLSARKDDINFLAIIRNPVVRAYSGFFQSDGRAQLEDFIEVGTAEMDIILNCYINGSLFINEKHCHSPEEHYEALEKCVTQVETTGRP